MWERVWVRVLCILLAHFIILAYHHCDLQVTSLKAGVQAVTEQPESSIEKVARTLGYVDRTRDAVASDAISKFSAAASGARPLKPRYRIKNN